MKRESRSEHNPIHASNDGGSEKAERLAPLEERAGKRALQTSRDEGLINVDTGSLTLPKEFTEKGEGKSRILGIEPITFFILAFALAFIAFIAYLISKEPAKVKDEPNPAVEQQP